MARVYDNRALTLDERINVKSLPYPHNMSDEQSRRLDPETARTIYGADGPYQDYGNYRGDSKSKAHKHEKKIRKYPDFIESISGRKK